MSKLFNSHWSLIVSPTSPDMALDAFRAEARAWLEANCPAAMRAPMQSEADICWGGRDWEFASADQKLWLERMAAKGWTAPTWPVDYGGGGLSREQHKVLKAEMARIKARSPLESFGLWMLGPALLKYGDAAQKAEHLLKICRGEIRWCQGYSEPGAGSDLAALQTKAEDKGDHFLVNGAKIWTSYADRSDWIFCLVRTDAQAPKHQGISFLLFDMASAGVSTQPITLISGKSPFCQTFFDDVKVPKENLVGERNKGWEIAKYLLAHEREVIGAGGAVAGPLGLRAIGEVAADALGRDAAGRLDDPSLRAEAMRADVDAWAFMLTADRLKDEAAAGRPVGARSSLLKYYGSELNKRRYELAMRAGGSDALAWEGARSNEGELARAWLRTKANSIEGGTSEVQLNILAKRVLELPQG